MDKVETVARAMCRADGGDPDFKTWAFDDPDREATIGGGDIVVGVARGPRWHQYRRLARRFIAAHSALKFLDGAA